MVELSSSEAPARLKHRRWHRETHGHRSTSSGNQPELEHVLLVKQSRRGAERLARHEPTQDRPCRHAAVRPENFVRAEERNVRLFAAECSHERTRNRVHTIRAEPIEPDLLRSSRGGHEDSETHTGLQKHVDLCSKADSEASDAQPAFDSRAAEVDDQRALAR
eukprot:Amastigsp_a510052_33.p2 type:complete len:163 gc:universal Amastigsp_a510052_33:593-1081(+)